MTLEDLKARREGLWINPLERETPKPLPEIEEARERLERFKPVIRKLFPETGDGLIESPIASLSEGHLLKCDHALPIAGSVKARGGIHEVLQHTEELGLTPETVLSPEGQALLSEQKIEVGSTGNLGLSIGIMGAALGYEAVVHMSHDAKAWKKALLREKGVSVREYEGSYTEAVRQGRERSAEDPKSYFVDDESSMALFAGYAVAAKRVKKQLEEMDKCVDASHPLFLYIPCGVGGAPAGIGYGFRLLFGDAVEVFFVEPVDSPAVLAGLMTGRGEHVSVEELGLSGRTEADGLAVGRPSGLCCRLMARQISGIFTIPDEALGPLQRKLWEEKGIFAEPSAAAAFAPLRQQEALSAFMEERGIDPGRVLHLYWSTGGSLVPEAERKKMLLGIRKSCGD